MLFFWSAAPLLLQKDWANSTASSKETLDQDTTDIGATKIEQEHLGVEPKILLIDRHTTARCWNRYGLLRHFTLGIRTGNQQRFPPEPQLSSWLKVWANGNMQVGYKSRERRCLARVRTFEEREIPIITTGLEVETQESDLAALQPEQR